MDILRILTALLYLITSPLRKPVVNEYPYEIPAEIESGDPYVPQTWREIEQAAQALYGQGDDIVYPIDDGKSQAGIKGDTYRWPNKTIPITITKEVSQDNQLLQVIEQVRQYLLKHTCVTFKPKTAQDKHWVTIYNNVRKCNSYVGCQKTQSQPMNLGEGCKNFGTVLHEFLHAFGCYHEHTRSDRDNHIWVYKNNVLPNEWHNFEKTEAKNEVTPMEDYSTGSIMHYGELSFSKDRPGGLKTMEAKDGKTILLDPWQKKDMTPEDIKLIKTMYCK